MLTEPHAANEKPRRGRPRLQADALLTPRTVRFSKKMLCEIDAIREERALEQPDFGQVVRELVAEALRHRTKRQ